MKRLVVGFVLSVVISLGMAAYAEAIPICGWCQLVWINNAWYLICCH